MGIFASIAGGLLSGIGSLFGGGNKDQVVKHEVDYVKMARNAEAAGFNPLTAIRNGGSAGFGVTTSPALSSQDAIGSFFGSIGQSIANYDPNADARNALEFDLAQAQLKNINADTAQKMHSMDVPTYSGARVTARTNAWGGPLDGAPAITGNDGNAYPKSHITTMGRNGPMVSANMDNQSDFETNAMTEANDGNLGPWGAGLIKKNLPGFAPFARQAAGLATANPGAIWGAIKMADDALPWYLGIKERKAHGGAW